MGFLRFTGVTLYPNFWNKLRCSDDAVLRIRPFGLGILYPWPLACAPWLVGGAGKSRLSVLCMFVWKLESLRTKRAGFSTVSLMSVWCERTGS